MNKLHHTATIMNKTLNPNPYVTIPLVPVYWFVSLIYLLAAYIDRLLAKEGILSMAAKPKPMGK